MARIVYYRRFWLAFFLGALSFLAACLLEPFSLDGYPCTPSGECGDGLMCANGFCRQDNNDECDKDLHCLCHQRCQQKDQTCVPIQSKTDKECQRCKYRCHQGRCIPEGLLPAPCKVHQDCKKSLYCKNNFCEPPCKNTEKDCPKGRICQGGLCQLPGEGQLCNPRDGCQAGLLCYKIKGAYTCRKACDPLEPLCPTPQRCFLPTSRQPGSAKGICLSPNNGKKQGERCNPLALSPECEVHLYCLAYQGKNLCRKLCPLGGTLCAKDEFCYQFDKKLLKLGACVPFTCSATAPCPPGSFCDGGICRNGCRKDSDCLGQQFCKEKQCVKKECDYLGRFCPILKACKQYQCVEEDPAPKSCTKNDDCADSKKVCVEINSSKHCRLLCYLGDQAVCGTTRSCAPLKQEKWPGQGICLPRNGGGQLGAPCDSLLRSCEHSYVCLGFDNASICLPFCYPNSHITCEQITGKKGWECTTSSTKLSYCRNKTERQKEESCGPLDGECTTGLECVADTSLRGRCYQKCDPSSDNCPNGYDCKELTDGSGACFPKK